MQQADPPQKPEPATPANSTNNPPITPELLEQFKAFNEQIGKELVDNLNRNALKDHPPGK